MKLSSTQYTANGLTKDAYFYFTGQDAGYIRKSDVKVTVDKEPVEFTLTSPNSLTLTEIPPQGATVLIRRVMPKNKTYADFTRGNNFREQTINNSFLQLLYTIHELLDGYFSGEVEFNDAVTMLSDFTVNGDSVFKGLAAFQGKTSFDDIEVPDNVDDAKAPVNLQTADARYIKQGGQLMNGVYSIVNKLIIQQNLPTELSSVMNISGNDERYARRGGDTLEGLYKFKGTVQVLANKVEDLLSVMNIAGNDLRYVRNGGQLMQGLYQFRNGATINSIDFDEPRSAVNLGFTDGAYVKRDGDTLNGIYRFDGGLEVKYNVPTNPDAVMNVGGNDLRYIQKAGGSIGNLTAEWIKVREVPEDKESVINRRFAENNFVGKAGVSTVTGIIDARQGRVLVGDPFCKKSAINQENLELGISVFEERLQQIQADAERQLSDLIAAISAGSLLNTEGTCLTYHYREIDKLILVPENCEARTIGNGVKILEGGIVRIGLGSHWQFTEDAKE